MSLTGRNGAAAVAAEESEAAVMIAIRNGSTIQAAGAGGKVPACRQAGMPVTLIVAAGGTGSRFQKSFRPKAGSTEKSRSKLFYPLQERPILLHTLEAFRSFRPVRETIVAAPKETIPELKRMIQNQKFSSVKVIAGGQTRAESVRNALKVSTPAHSWIMVHDGARPFVTSEALDRLMKAVKEGDGAILARKVVPTLKSATRSGKITGTVDRSSLYEAETPQLVKRDLLLRAYREIPDALKATDEASLLESLQAKLKVVTHDGWNPKITTFNDFELAESYLDRLTPPVTRTGIGKDLHRLAQGRKLYLGGIEVPSPAGAVGHSDGDVLIHAVIDGILGAMGLGDIGEWFSDQNPKWKNVRSRKLLERVMQKAAEEGWRIEHIDSIVFLERPKLSAAKKKIRASLSRLLKVPVSAVSVKAKTMEGLGPIGTGEAVSCEAIVTMRKSA